MAFEPYIEPKKAFVFGLDDVLYPEKDYLLQVYYLFSEFMAYSLQLDSKEMITFMQAEFAADGATAIFEKTAAKFEIPEKYAANFALLHQNARLPLKLLLYQQVLSFLQEVVLERKEIYLLIDGNPLQQLNKIKQVEWHGLEQYLKLYFTEEFEVEPSIKSLQFVIDQHQLNKEEMLMVGVTAQQEAIASAAAIDYLSVTKLL